VYKQISANKRNSILLLIGFLLLYAGLGWLFSLWLGQAALFLALFIAVFMVIINLYAGDDLVALVSGARRVERREEAPELWRRVENLAITAGIPMPRIYISNEDTPNAFAAGRNPKQAIVCVTTGLLARLDEEELEGVLAHELSHIRNYDVRLMTWAAVLAGSVALLANILLRTFWFGGDRQRGGNPLLLVAIVLGAILAPIAAVVIQLAISRRREYVADAAGAELTRYPQGLASALQTIEANAKPSIHLSNPSIAHLMIAPQLGAMGRTSKLFSTHPSTADRVTRLEEMAGGDLHRHEQLTEGAALPRAEPVQS
jgi:heat shock protein HtpX